MPLNLSDDDHALWKRRIGAAEHDQRKYHPLWAEVLAFCQGHQWVKYAGNLSRRLVTIPPPKYGRRYTVDELTQYRLTLLGEFATDDDRPEVHFRADQRPAEDYAKQANLALGYGWEEEWQGQEVLEEAKRTMIDLGTAPLRCRFDKTKGPMTGEKPFLGDQMLTTSQAVDAIDQGQPVRLRNIREGRITWDAGMPFNALVPPGLPREKDFPWVVWKSVESVADMKARYPGREILSDPVRSLATLARPQDVTSGPEQGPYGDNLGEHCFAYTAYQFPSEKYPQGRVIVFANELMTPLETIDTLPYRAPDGSYRAGIYFLHAIRLVDRFWSRGFIELALDPQRAINEHSTRIEQTIAHGQPFRWIEEGAVKKMPDGAAGSVGYLKPGKPKPLTDPGMSPGVWMYDVIKARREDLARAVLPEAALGENPTNVTTYSQLALLHSQGRKRLSAIIRQNQEVVTHLMEDSIWDIRTKWGPEKQILLAGTEGMMEVQTFNASVWPDFYKIGFATGASLPRQQDAQIKLIEDMWNAAIQSGAAVRDPDGWLAWRKQSLEAGKMMSLPTVPVEAQRAKAEYENEVIFSQPDPQTATGLVDYFDNHPLHLPIHRAMQSAARLSGRNDVFVAMEMHCKEHERQALLTAMQQIGQQGPTVPTALPQHPPAEPQMNGGGPGSPTS